MMNKTPTYVFALFALSISGFAQAEVIEGGSAVCVEEDSILALQQATRENNDSALSWLMDGAACMRTARSLQVEVLQISADGFAEVRTTRKRRNHVLWAHQSNVISDQVALAASQQ